MRRLVLPLLSISVALSALRLRVGLAVFSTTVRSTKFRSSRTLPGQS